MIKCMQETSGAALGLPGGDREGGGAQRLLQVGWEQWQGIRNASLPLSLFWVLCTCCQLFAPCCIPPGIRCCPPGAHQAHLTATPQGGHPLWVSLPRVGLIIWAHRVEAALTRSAQGPGKAQGH